MAPPCNPGDLGVDEDYSEQLITDLVNSREMYIIPLLNVDGYKYDHEVWVGANCAGDAWGDDCARSGWRKNLRDNTVTGVTPAPDLDEDVDPSCDGVDLNRNYQYEWGAPLGATGPSSLACAMRVRPDPTTMSTMARSTPMTTTGMAPSMRITSMATTMTTMG